MKKAVVCWTGGKDSALALYEARLLGYEITQLVTFVPDEPNFLAHPLHLIKLQSEAIGIPHKEMTIREPYKESYEEAIQSLKAEAAAIVTGDISEIAGHPNWIKECSKKSKMEVLAPLWYQDREYLINRLLSKKFKVIFSLIKKPWFKDDSLLGKELDKNTLLELRSICKNTGMDLCGEQGEYHTLALDGPLFNKPISVNFSKNSKDNISYLKLD